MKNIFLFISILFYSFNLIGQSNIDILFPVKGKPVKNCKILEIGPANSVTYLFFQDTLSALAKACIKDGEFYDLGQVKNLTAKHEISLQTLDSLANITYKGHHYQYYHRRYLAAKKVQKTGIILMAAGGGVGALGAGLYLYGEKAYEKGKVTDPTFIYTFPGILLAIAGGATMATGIIMSGVSYSIAQKNKNYMERCTSQEVSLHMGLQQNGIGVRLVF